MTDDRTIGSPYHEGELEVQRRAGVTDKAARLGRMFRPEIAPAAREFLAAQPWVVLGAPDDAGRTWATVLTGAPGFARTLDDRTVALDAEPAAGDPLASSLTVGREVGLLAIEPAHRRRIRLNGAVVGLDPLRVSTSQVYANCPKYIQAREVAVHPERVSRPPAEPSRSSTLDDRARRWIETADTFFIASAAPDHGADVSHRGGRPGFVRVEDGRICWPDYSGNNMFNTLGNLTADPSAGLLFVDFARGDVLQVTGEASVDWDPQRAAGWAGAERVVDFTVREVVRRDGALPLWFGDAEPSPFNP